MGALKFAGIGAVSGAILQVIFAVVSGEATDQGPEALIIPAIAGAAEGTLGGLALYAVTR
jgi:hypothetical protein